MRRRWCWPGIARRPSARWRRLRATAIEGTRHDTGYVDSARNDLYADALMLVLPSYEEGLDSGARSQACGVPVIVSSRDRSKCRAGRAPIDPDDADGSLARAALLEAMRLRP